MSQPISNLTHLDIIMSQVKQAIIRQYLDQRSFTVSNILPRSLKQTAAMIPLQLINSPIGSADGLQMTYDKPLGCKKFMCNLQRPAVLRQHFGLRVQKEDKNVLFSYGSGSGSITVGTHPSFCTTREMTPNMNIISHRIHDSLCQLQRDEGIPNLTCSPFNHCTVLLYFHKHSSSPDNMLGFHTDNVFSTTGTFNKNKNTQRENTPTCVLTLGSTRQLHFQKQWNDIDKKTNKRKWHELTRRRIELDDNSLFVLHPEDECPQYLGNILKTRWRHGVPNFNQQGALSVALVFRTVTTTIDTTPNSNQQLIWKLPGDAFRYSSFDHKVFHEHLKTLSKIISSD